VNRLQRIGLSGIVWVIFRGAALTGASSHLARAANRGSAFQEGFAQPGEAFYYRAALI